MLFGLIKTKKDKKIEELNAEIDRVKSVFLSPPVFKVEKHPIDTYRADFCVNFEDLDNLPDRYVETILTNKMLEVVEKNLVVEHTNDYQRGCTYYSARLRVVREDGSL